MSLLERAERDGFGGFHVDEAEQLFSLQRLISAQLVQARTRNLGVQRLHYLDSLVKRGHNLLYPNQRNLGSELRDLVLGGFARAFRQTARLQAVAWIFFLAGAWFGFSSTRSELEFAYPLVGLMYPADFVQGLIESEAERSFFLRAGRESGAGAQSVFFTALFLNNTRAAIAAFAFGIFAGIPTILILLLNGALLGSFAALFHQGVHSAEFWAWVLPHAIPEIAAVCVAAAAGLRLGLALIDPGSRSRRAAVARAGRGSAILIGFAVFLLFYAAFVEAFIRQSALPMTFRYGLALLNFVSLAAYLAFAGLQRRGPMSTSSTLHKSAVPENVRSPRGK